MVFSFVGLWVFDPLNSYELLWNSDSKVTDWEILASSFTVVETLTTNARGQQFQATLHLEDLKWMNYKWITYLKSYVWTKLRETFGVHWSMLCPSLQSFQSLQYLLRNRRLFEHTACNAFFWQNAIKMRKMQILRILFFFPSISIFFLRPLASAVSWAPLRWSWSRKPRAAATERMPAERRPNRWSPISARWGARVWPWKDNKNRRLTWIRYNAHLWSDFKDLGDFKFSNYPPFFEFFFKVFLMSLFFMPRPSQKPDGRRCRWSKVPANARVWIAMQRSS